MKTKSYIIFYKFYNPTEDKSGNGFIDKVEITKRKKDDVDIMLLNKNVQDIVIKRKEMSLKTEVVITNIIEQKL